MKKPESLKAVLLDAVPGIAADPTKLSMFIDKGRVCAQQTQSLSFEYRYTLSIVVMDYAGEVDALIIPILAWISTNQPDLMESGDHEPFSFESEILDTNTADVSIDIELTERVLVRRSDGGIEATHLDEPPPLLAFDEVGASPWTAVLDDLTNGAP